MDLTALANNIASLAKRIEDARAAYYHGLPLMTDAAYDALEDELRALDPSHSLLAKVGAPLPGGGWPKVKHAIPMGSLNKAQTEQDFRAWVQSCGVGPAPKHLALLITEKLDGLSVALRYFNRQLVQALTRGDGETGEDITRNVLLMKGAVRTLPATLPSGAPMPANVYVRGEIVCLKSDFAEHFKGESNPRNTAAGTAKRQTGFEKCQYITIIAYQFLPDGQPLPSKAAEIFTLRELGFRAPGWNAVTDIEAALGIYQRYIDQTRASLDYDIDGMVIEWDSAQVRNDLGMLNSRPKGATAFKFPHDEKATTLRDIRWQVGKSGRLTPVADFDTVNLAGANVAKATLHGIDIIETLCQEAKVTTLHAGDTILVSRKGDVIPGVESIVTSNSSGPALATPTQCPECGTALIREGAYLKCPNGDCPAQIRGALSRWISKIGVLHFGDALIDLLCESGEVETIADLYKLDPANVALMSMGGRMVGGTATKAFNNLHAHKVIPLHVFVGSLGIPLIGRSMAKTIVDAGYDTLNKMSRAKPVHLAGIPGVGQTKAEAFCEGFWDLLDRGVITGLLPHITIADKASGAMSGKSVCCTGFRDKTLEAEIEAQGGTVKSSVSKDLTILVAKEPNSTSGKALQASKYGIEVIGVDEMWKRLGK